MRPLLTSVCLLLALILLGTVGLRMIERHRSDWHRLRTSQAIRPSACEPHCNECRQAIW